MVSSSPKVRKYLQELDNALNAEGFNRQRVMNSAREIQSTMNEKELVDLGEQLKFATPKGIRLALGIGLKTPTRKILDDTIAKGGVIL